MEHDGTKLCSGCFKTKLLIDFHGDRRTKDGRVSRCKSCCSLYKQVYYSENKERAAKKRKYFQSLYLQQWDSFFRVEYGIKPICEICGKQLKWYGKGNKADIIHFDHKMDGTGVRYAPHTWIEGHPCNERNIEIWRNANLGILCSMCNQFLPTCNREEWWERVTNYIKGGKQNGV